MKFIKRLALDRSNQISNRFAVETDDKIVTTSKVSLQLPSGTQGQRPLSLSNGQIRYSTTENDTEIYNVAGQGTGWERVLTNRQHTITPQNLGVGNYINTLFGPLSYDVSTSKPQNVMVFIDNVYQIPTTNYSLVLGTSISVDHQTNGSTPSSSNSIHLYDVADILIGQNISASTGIDVGTTVTSITTSTKTIDISLPTSGIIPAGTTCTFTFQAGTFIEFTSAVPAKQVFTLLGFDGYSP